MACAVYHGTYIAQVAEVDMTYQNGQVTTATWHDYPIATSLDGPEDIDVVFTP